MSTTKDFKASDGAVITMRRPSFRAFHRVASKVEALLDIDLGTAMGVPEFEEVLRACIQDVDGKATRAHTKRTQRDSETGIVKDLDDDDALDAWLEDADYQEAARLWDEIVKLGEFIPFLTKHEEEHGKRTNEKEQRQIKQAQEKVKMMKKEGALPPEFSLSDEFIRGMLREDANRMTSLESLTGTQASTDGPESKSNEKTTGSSSETTRKRQKGEKRKNG